jgi:threonine/homoserine efflux transporter RhtA
VRIQVLTGAIMKIIVFWDVTPCSLLESDRRFRFALIMYGVNMSEMLMNFYETAERYIPEECHLLFLPV